MAFVIDTLGEKYEPLQEEEEIREKSTALVSQLLKEYKEGLLVEDLPFEQLRIQGKKVTKAKRKQQDFDLDELYKDLGWTNKAQKNTKSNKRRRGEDEDIIKKLTNTSKDEIQEVLKKSVLTPGFENLHTVPPANVSERKLKAERKREREKTKGDKWFGLPATEKTPEVKRDLEIIKMRSVLDPKHFYKKNDMQVLPKYFQIGKVMDSPLDYYNNRLTKKERKRTLVDELLANAEFNKYNKRKYKEIIEEKKQTNYKAWRQGRKLKKKKN